MTVEIKGLGKLTAKEDVLKKINDIVLYASCRAKEQHLEAIRREYDEIFVAIFDALDAKGYYDNVKF